VRDANLYAVEKLIAYAIDHRDEVESAETQKTQTAEEIAAAQAELMARGDHCRELEAKLAEPGIRSRPLAGRTFRRRDQSKRTRIPSSDVAAGPLRRRQRSRGS